MRMTKKHRQWLAGLVVAAFLVRLVLAALTAGYPYDTNCFWAWGLKMADTGAAGFYSEGYFADYPPGYMLLLGLTGRAARLLQVTDFTGVLSRVLLVFFPALADCGLAALVFFIGKRYADETIARRASVFMALCPVLLFDTAVWKQIDGLFALPMLGCFYLLEQKRYLPAALAFGAALAVKPQALLAGPVLAVCFLVPVFQAESGRARLRAAGTGALGIPAALVVPLVCGLPFWGLQTPVRLWEKYTSTTQSYPYASLNAFNVPALLGGNWVDQDSLCGPLTYRQWGLLGIAMLSAALAVLAFAAVRRGRLCPLLLAALYTVGVFTLAHRMHERYLILGIVFLLAAAAKWADVRLFAVGFGYSVTALLNLAIVYCQTDTEDQWLSSATSRSFVFIVSLLQTLLFAALVCTVWDLLVRGGVRRLELPGARPVEIRPRPAWTRGEALRLAALTAAVAAVSVWNLGDLTAPQTVLDTVDAAPETVQVQVAQGESLPQRVWVYAGVNSGGTLKITADDTGETVAVELDYRAVYHWLTQEIPASRSYTIRAENVRVVELSLRNAEGGAVAVEPADSALFDEAALVPETISQLNTAYFDEIYHARTGYETLHGMEIYETTHPPLGKDLIALGIALFGMTGFGWRISGVVFGVLMVPVLYALVRRLTGKRNLALVAAALLGLDFMRYAQSRIATIDVYATFFVLTAAWLMIWYAQSALEKGIHRSLLPMALCGIAFGCGCASKWTGLYAGAGLAVVYFGVLWLRSRQRPAQFGREIALALSGGVVFFVVIPLAIYLASYLPFCAREASFSLTDWWNCQTYMYRYHSGLEATHPFESRWYTWLFDLRPVWYYQNTLLTAGSYASIAGMGNPVIWWSGTFAVCALGAGRLCGRGDRRWDAVLVFYLAQLLPWVLVTRCTFIYHYFSGMCFGIVAVALLLEELARRNRRAARVWAAGLCAAAGVLFAVCFPALCGLPVSAAWAGRTLLFPGWGFYIL